MGRWTEGKHGIWYPALLSIREASIRFYEVIHRAELCVQEQSGEERIQLQLSCSDSDQIMGFMGMGVETLSSVLL